MRGVGLLVVFVAVALAKLPPSEWKEFARAAPTVAHTFNLGLFQRNKESFFQRVLDLSNPQHPAFKEPWMTIDEVNNWLAPPASVKDEVKRVLRAANIHIVRDMGDYFRITAKVSDIESLFSTTVHEYRNPKSRSVLLRAKGYTIPMSLAKHVEIVSGLTELPRKTLQPKIHNKKTRKSSPASEEIIPEFIRLIYNISQTANVGSTNSSYCVAEFQDDNAYLKSDMALFYKNMAEPAYKITDVGPFSTDGGPDAESSLDIQFGGAIARGTQNYFWVDLTWMLSFSQALFARQNAPQVVSMSWGWPENGQCESGIGSCSDPQDYVSRTNTEFAKVVARGITLVAASGDQGAPGDNFPGCSAGLSDLFPASSPWVLAVGATMLGNAVGNTKAKVLATPVTAPVCHQRSVSCARGDITEEEVCTFPAALITSGGGFSQYTARPSWQNSAVEKYLQSSNLPPASMFNKTNRAFPDVAALGHNYLVYLSGSITPVDGTSCSSPVFAAIIALLNAQRAQAGKKSLGFSNQVWYQAPPGAFRDITKGNNKATEGCVSNYGFESAVGWDPVTGLGTPNYPVLSSYVAGLP